MSNDMTYTGFVRGDFSIVQDHNCNISIYENGAYRFGLDCVEKHSKDTMEAILNAYIFTHRSFIDMVADIFKVEKRGLEVSGTKRPPDLTGKCGSCKFSIPSDCFGGSTSYVECTNREHLNQYCRDHLISAVRQRTTPGCKLYQKRSVDLSQSVECSLKK